MDKTIVNKLRDLHPLTYAGLGWKGSMRAIEKEMGHHDRSRDEHVREPDTIEHRIAA
jgi:hypothetical protein